MASSWTTSGSWSKLGSENNFTGSGMWDRAKDLESPFKPGGSESAYTPQGGFNFDAGLGKKAFGADDSKFNWKKAYDLSSKFLSKATEKGERDDALRNLPYMLDRGSRGSGGQVFEGFGYINPTQHGPIVIPGVQSGGGGGGLLRDVGGLAGTLGTAAGVFGPLGAPIGMAVGGLIDRFAGT